MGLLAVDLLGDVGPVGEERHLLRQASLVQRDPLGQLLHALPERLGQPRGHLVTLPVQPRDPLVEPRQDRLEGHLDRLSLLAARRVEVLQRLPDGCDERLPDRVVPLRRLVRPDDSRKAQEVAGRELGGKALRVRRLPPERRVARRGLGVERSGPSGGSLRADQEVDVPAEDVLAYEAAERRLEGGEVVAHLDREVEETVVDAPDHHRQLGPVRQRRGGSPEPGHRLQGVSPPSPENAWRS